MEIKINQLIGKKAYAFSASRMELGEDAGTITWNNSKREASGLEP